MVVNHNLIAENAFGYNLAINKKLGKSLEKLSSGVKINRAGDNAAGLAVSEKMRAQIAGIEQAVLNAEDGIGMLQTFEGALVETHAILNRIKMLAVQSANGIYTNETDRAAIELEYEQLISELDDISQTDFNGVMVMGKGGTVVRGSTVLMNVHHDATMSPSSGVSASVVGLQDATADELLAVTAGKAEVPARKASYEVTIDGTYNKLTALNDEWNIQLGSFTATSSGFNFATGSTVTLLTGNDVSIPAGFMTGTQFIAFLNSNVTALGIDTTKYDVNITHTMDAPTTQVIGINIKAKNAGAADVLSLPSSVIINGSTEITGGGTAHAVTGRDASDSTFTIFDYNLMLGDGDGIDDMITDINGVLMGSGYTASKVGTNVLKLERNTDGVDPSSSLRLNIDTANPNGMTIGDTVSESPGVDYAAAVEPAITTSGWARQSSGVYKKGDVIITLGATTADGTIDIKKAYDAMESVYVPATVSNTDSVSLQVGARTKDLKNYDFKYDQVWAKLDDPDAALKSSIGTLVADVCVTAKGLGLVTTAVNLSTQYDANTAIDKIDHAINKTSMIRATFGAIQNRLEHKIDNLNTTDENLTAAESRIRDTNIANEIMNASKLQILSQSSQSMLAQANNLPQSVLSFLQ